MYMYSVPKKPLVKIVDLIENSISPYRDAERE